MEPHGPEGLQYPLSKMSQEGPILEYRTQIHLFLVAPRRLPKSPVQGTLVAADLENKPDYIMLLYTPEDTEDSAIIHANGRPLVVRKGLERLLQALSNSPSYGKKYIFDDSLCVQPKGSEEEYEVDQEYLVRAEMNAAEVVIGLGIPTRAEVWLVNILKVITAAILASDRLDPTQSKEITGGLSIDLLEAILGLLERLWSIGHANVAGVGSVRKLSYVFDDGLVISNRMLDLLFTRPRTVCASLELLRENITQDLLSSQVFARSSCGWDLGVKFQIGPPGLHQLLYGTRFHDSASRLQDFLGFCYLASLRLSDQTWMDYHEDPAVIMCRWSALIANLYGILGLLAEVSQEETELPSWATLVQHPAPHDFVPLVFDSLCKIDESDFRAGGNRHRQNAMSSDLISKCCFRSVGLYLATLTMVLEDDVPLDEHNIESEHLDMYRTGRQFARLNRVNKLALVPQKARTGDRIFVLPGFRVPYVLRELNVEDRRISDGRSFRLVGEALVPFVFRKHNIC